jgi:hypothetical protein
MWPFKAKAQPEAPVLEGHRQGETYVAEFDYDRLNQQMKKVYDVVKDGKWISLSDLAAKTASPEASVSARLRDLRKSQYGALTVERRRVKERGLYEYRLLQDN